MNSFYQNSVRSVSEFIQKIYLLMSIFFVLFLAGSTIGCQTIKSGDENDLDRLFKIASGDPALSKSTADSKEAIHQLASHKGARVTNMLLAIATQDSPLDLLGGGTRSDAIRALANRGDETVAVKLAHQLQIYEVYDTRLAVAETLLQLPCNEDCIGLVLHYLERIYYGELNPEKLDVMEDKIGDAAFQNRVRAEIEKEDQKLFDDLYAVLAKNDRTTIIVLYNDYGLGRNLPTRFSIAVAMNAKIGMACQLLLRSQEILGQDSWAGQSAYYNEINKVIAALKCK